MSYRFADRLDLLGKRMKEINFEKIILQRIDCDPVTIERASPGFHDEYVDMPGVAMTQVTYQDWICDSADLGDLLLPIPGDIITRVKTGASYRVVSPNHDDACYKFTTPSEKRIRIHTSQFTQSEEFE